MKVLWVEDHEPVRTMLTHAADKAARARIPVDLVMAEGLLAAERRLRLERFDLVIVDLQLPETGDDVDMAVARIANMGKHRIAVSSSRPERDDVVASAVRCGANIHPVAVFKAGLNFNRFIQRPESFEDFLLELMPAAGARSTASRAA
ncbi:response regulator [Hyphomonas sp. WL0036]|uniref:response regulator n=1 Tax=Hyphomonas sediminis TaxID=2866160 RepID=UPI001C81E9C9|nr:response regulator [Hyphomonas sediminis]MBY9065687.1 response regulator [Hyphomonas sediminis]